MLFRFVTRVMKKLGELGVVDDENTGRALIREIQSRKPAGPRLLRVKLMQKGLDRALVDRLLAELSPSTDESVEGARELAKKKLRSMTRLDAMTKKRRIYGMLARRGFGPDVISQALENLPGLRDGDADTRE